MGLDLTKIIRAAKATDKIITPTLNDWLMKDGDSALPIEVAERIYTQMIEVPRDRSASFSSSSAGQCPRRQVLAYLGVPSGDTIDPRLQNIFNDGKWRHMRWQAMLLSAGLLDSMEEPLFWRRMRSRGTMDGRGVVPDDHPRQSWRNLEYGFELKGVGSYIYPKYVKLDDEVVKEEHENQVARYFLMSGLDLFVIIYENKGTNEWHEWVVEPNLERIKEQMEELELLNDSVDSSRLPQILPSCKISTGPQYKECPYGGNTKKSQCHAAGTWPI